MPVTCVLITFNKDRQVFTCPSLFAFDLKINSVLIILTAKEVLRFSYTCKTAAGSISFYYDLS
jgi:hypothetical protein